MNSDDRCAVDRVQERTHFLEGKFSTAGKKRQQIDTRDQKSS
jgi:hypothetical protein